jgi:uncharacterized membrane protein YgaE (UPF0421/DUF939 family)
MKMKKACITCLDMRIAVSVLVCYLTASLLNHFGFQFSFGEMKIEIIQKMAACISCLLCCQDTTQISKKAGINRLIITAVGGSVAVLVVIFDTVITNEWLMTVMVAAGVLLTLYFCKAAKVPYINARIGGVTFIIVVCALQGHARICYAVFRFVSTLYGVIIVLFVTWLFERFIPNKNFLYDHQA